MALLARSMCRSQLLLRQIQPCTIGRVNSASSWRDDQAKFWQKNRTGNRPLSPHMTIYKFPLPAMLSGSHRATGFAMYSGLAIAGVFMTGMPLIVGGDYVSYLAIMKSWSIGPYLLFVAKWCVTWPFTYHLINGCRHLAWDMAIGLNMKSLYTTGYAVVGTSLALATAIAAM